VSQLTAVETAEQLGTDAKTLRRFLRQEPSYSNAGSGGRYTFTTGDIPSLRVKFDKWTNRPRKNRNSVVMVDEAGLPMTVCRSRDRSDIAAVRALTEARVDRLETALRARGLHVSQMRDRESV
jgi:hypothetical protein